MGQAVCSNLFIYRCSHKLFLLRCPVESHFSWDVVPHPYFLPPALNSVSGSLPYLIPFTSINFPASLHEKQAFRAASRIPARTSQFLCLRSQRVPYYLWLRHVGRLARADSRVGCYAELCNRSIYTTPLMALHASTTNLKSCASSACLVRDNGAP